MADSASHWQILPWAGQSEALFSCLFVFPGWGGNGQPEVWAEVGLRSTPSIPCRPFLLSRAVVEVLPTGIGDRRASVPGCCTFSPFQAGPMGGARDNACFLLSLPLCHQAFHRRLGEGGHKPECGLWRGAQMKSTETVALSGGKQVSRTLRGHTPQDTQTFLHRVSKTSRVLCFSGLHLVIQLKLGLTLK